MPGRIHRVTNENNSSRETVDEDAIREFTHVPMSTRREVIKQMAIGALLLGATGVAVAQEIYEHQQKISDKAETEAWEPWKYTVTEDDILNQEEPNVLWTLTTRFYPDMPSYDVIPFYTQNIVIKTADNDIKEDENAIAAGDILIITGPPPKEEQEDPSNHTSESRAELTSTGKQSPCLVPAGEEDLSSDKEGDCFLES